MTAVAEFTDGTIPPTQPVKEHRVTDRTAPGKFLRSVWRTHFYSAIFATPILIVLALSGLVIMYTEPITGLLYSDTTRVAARGIVGMTMLIIFITTGMPWSEYWGPAWSAVGSKLTPGNSVDAPSTPAKAGDLDRFGHQSPGPPCKTRSQRRSHPSTCTRAASTAAARGLPPRRSQRAFQPGSHWATSTGPRSWRASSPATRSCCRSIPRSALLMTRLATRR